jgi:hypothetical protein
MLGLVSCVGTAMAADKQCDTDAKAIGALAQLRINSPRSTERGIVDFYLLSINRENVKVPAWIQLKMYHLLDFAERNLTDGAEGAQKKYIEFCAQVGPLAPTGPD